MNPKIKMLTAAAKRLTRNKQDRPIAKTMNESWQSEAWDMYDLVGELRFIAGNLAGQAAKSVLYVGKQEGGDTPEKVEDPEVNRILEALNGASSSLSQMVHRLSMNLFVTGEGWLVGTPKDDPILGQLEPQGPEDYDWRMMSVSEVTTNSVTKEIELTIEGEQRKYPEDDVYVVRVWRPHPRHWWQADSPTRSSMPVLRELVGLTMHVYAQIESRLAGAGILAVPQSVQNALQVAAGLDPHEGEGSDRDEFTEALIEAMLTPISDRSAASALVPLTITIPDDAAGKIEHLTFSTPLDSEARNLRDEAIRRLALGLDAPPELLLGTGGMNHWGGWLVQEETVNTHIVPPLQLICDALTTQYLWPMLEEMGYQDFEDYVVWYDVDHMIVRPNLSSDAFTLHDKGVLSDDALRRVNGFDDTDAPEKPANLATVTVLRMIESDPSLMREPGIDALYAEVSRLVRGIEAEGLPSEGPSEAGAGMIPDTSDSPAELPDE